MKTWLPLVKRLGGTRGGWRYVVSGLHRFSLAASTSDKLTQATVNATDSRAISRMDVGSLVVPPILTLKQVVS